MNINIARVDIRNHVDLKRMLETFLEDNPKVIAKDSETDGLNIMFNKPFIFVFGYANEDFSLIKTYALDLENFPHLVDYFFEIFYDIILPRVELVLGHNITFDLHMVANIKHAYPELFYNKLSDTMSYIRLAEDAITPEEGGPPLALKDYVYRYIWKGAKLLQSKLKVEMKQKRLQNTAELLADLRDKPIIPKYQISGKEKRWTKGMVEEFLKDKLVEVEELPKEVQKPIQDYIDKDKLVENYRLLNRENVIYYAHYDIVLTLMVHKRDLPIIIERNQLEILKEENALIPIFYQMERAGKYFDLDYALIAKKKLKDYILSLTEKLKELLHCDVSANQYVALKDLLNEQYNLDLESTGKKVLKQITDPEVKKIAKIVIKLRTLRKWYSTYLVAWIDEAQKYNTKWIYPTYTATGAVTGRASSPYQQIPKEPLLDEDGVELFHPRKMMIVPEDYDLFYFDYSSMEMRMLAIYSTLLTEGDLNLCRLFIPFKCHERDGKWYFDEDPETEWKQSKPHDVTTKKAFNITEEDPQWDHFRRLGKSANFAIIYGAGVPTLVENLDITYELAKILYDGFYSTFPGMINYEMYVRNSILSVSYLENLFGRRYYGINSHKGKNYAIQGSCADYTKKLLPEINNLLKGKKSILENYLHDEFSFRIHKSERYLVPIIKAIMEQLDSVVPMIADVEIAEIDWSQKHDYDLS